ncbi:hypothetical protein TWF730_000231 [Orbilia blumenaviensis]|uniref:Uncharacterized protein n=1 Tax=Orbilia blumenaviensis TaxID=1796055 RepID=A0AAV9VKX4_9PEZI
MGPKLCSLRATARCFIRIAIALAGFREAVSSPLSRDSLTFILPAHHTNNTIPILPTPQAFTDTVSIIQNGTQLNSSSSITNAQSTVTPSRPDPTAAVASDSHGTHKLDAKSGLDPSFFYENQQMYVRCAAPVSVYGTVFLDFLPNPDQDKWRQIIPEFGFPENLPGYYSIVQDNIYKMVKRAKKKESEKEEQEIELEVLAQQQETCRTRCLCHAPTGKIVPSFRWTGVKCHNQWDAAKCTYLLGCYCSAILTQRDGKVPGIDPGIEDYQRAIDLIPSVVFEEPFNEGWRFRLPGYLTRPGRETIGRSGLLHEYGLQPGETVWQVPDYIHRPDENMGFAGNEQNYYLFGPDGYDVNGNLVHLGRLQFINRYARHPLHRGNGGGAYKSKRGLQLSDSEVDDENLAREMEIGD